ncbi:MAG: type II secretion system protein GspD [Rikenellaceae bacterium]|nr:type II secretion system protein GspD [Rikenellaceae bacterium]
MRKLQLLVSTLLLSILFPVVSLSRPALDSIRLVLLEEKLEELAVRDKAYNDEIDLSVGRMPLMELLRHVANVSKVNLSVRNAENIMVTCNFSRARIKELIFFLCKEYDLDIEVIGNIIAIAPVPPEKPAPPDPTISYDREKDLISYDLGGERLIDVAKKITQVSGVNVIIPQPLYVRQVSGYVENMEFDQALSTLASVNGMDAVKNRNGIWEIIPNNESGVGQQNMPQYSRRSYIAANELHVDSLGYITAQITRGNIRDIITDLCEQLGFNYFFLSPLDHQTSVFIRDVEFESLMATLLSGTPYSYYRENGIYVFGSLPNNPGLFSVRVIPLVYRSVNKLEDIIPDNLRSGLQVKQFPDLNSIVASGDQRSVIRLESFLRSIDRRVPLVTIEVMIVDVNKKNLMETGIGMGKGTLPSSSQTISPGLDMTVGAYSVNKMLNSFSGFGSVKLGKVSSDFYLSLKFLEENDVIEIRSTPKLSTLNGHEATLKSGEKRYYKEITNTWMGTQNPVQNESWVWRDVEANLSLTIIPFVSEDEMITLEIEIEQTEFKESGASVDDVPPATNTRSFKSLVRVENEEMVLLGGIDQNRILKGSKGLPLIARIPVLKWIFGNSKNNKEDYRLSIFIKPTIID